jgi:hypothetical protein
MSTLVLHIGSHKTGTTSIQHACRFALPTTGAVRCHYFNIRPSGVRVLANAGSGADFGATVDLGSADQVFRPVTGPDAPDLYVTSDEEFFWIHEPDGVHRLADLLKARFETIRILCYLRRQDLLALSHRKQVLSDTPATRFYGVTATPLPEYQPHLANYFDYAAKLADIWASAFGKDNITLVPFEKPHLAQGDAVADFASRLGITFGAYDAEPANSSYAGNQTFLGLLLAEAKIPRKERLQIVRSLPERGRFLPSRDEARAFLSHFAAANERLAREWQYNGGPFIFDAAFDMYPETATSTWDSTDVADMIAAVLAREQEKPGAKGRRAAS